MLLFAAVPLLALAAADAPAGKTEARTITAFHAVDASGSHTIEIAAGKPSLSLTGDPADLAQITTTVKDGTLTIKCATPCKTKGPVSIKATTDVVVDSYALSGSGALTTTIASDKAVALAHSGSGKLLFNAAAAELSASVSGSGAIVATGKGKKLTATVNGSGTVDATAFEVGDAVANVSGSGEVRLFATTALTSTVSGSGRVLYKGAAKVTKTVNGSGVVDKLPDTKDKPAAKDAEPKKAAAPASGW